MLYVLVALCGVNVVLRKEYTWLATYLAKATAAYDSASGYDQPRTSNYILHGSSQLAM